MSWVNSLCTTSDAELLSMASGLSFRNRSWRDQALGVWGLMIFLGGISWHVLGCFLAGGVPVKPASGK